jgi:hypothetical protein
LPRVAPHYIVKDCTITQKFIAIFAKKGESKRCRRWATPRPVGCYRLSGSAKAAFHGLAAGLCARRGTPVVIRAEMTYTGL